METLLSALEMQKRSDQWQRDSGQYIPYPATWLNVPEAMVQAIRDSAYGEEQIFNIIDARTNSKLLVIVTTNLTLEELEHPISMQYARIYDRVLEMCPVWLKQTGASRRKGNAETRK